MPDLILYKDEYPAYLYPPKCGVVYVRKRRLDSLMGQEDGPLLQLVSGNSATQWIQAITKSI